MRLLLILLIIFIKQKSYCQNSVDIYGKWHVVVMDNGVRYDYETGKHIVSKALQDSLSTWKGAAFNLDDYISWASSCSDCYYLFKQDSIYQEFRGNDVRTEGTYLLSLNDSTIKVTTKSQTQSNSKYYKYYIIGQRLFLSVPSFWTKENLRLELKKVD